MYEFITHTWNTVKGKCPHDCSYCYMKRWGKLNPVRFDKKELKEFDRDIKKYGNDNFIFVGSSCDMFAPDIPHEWILETLHKCFAADNDYFFQSKNPFRFRDFEFPKKSSFCTTIETNRFYMDIMGNTPEPHERAFSLPFNNYITIEPVMDFDLEEMIILIKLSSPKQVNIGADTGKNGLPEPSKEKIISLIEGLNEFTIVHKKSNLKRLLK